MFNQFANDFFEILSRATGWFLRSPKMLAHLRSIADGLNNVNARLITVRDEIIERTKWNAEIIVLERFLNEQYSIIYDHNTRDADIVAGTIIYIEDTSNIPATFIYNRSEIPPEINTFIYNRSEIPPKVATFIRNRGELVRSILHYIVKIPIAISHTEVVVRDQVDRYNLAGKNYLVETY